MARARKAGDAAYNARRRYGRQAQRYLKKAGQTSGASAERYRALAREAYENAMATYDPKQKQKISSRLIDVGRELGIDTQGARSEFITKIGEQRKQELIEKSKQALESALQDPEKRREREARILLSSTSVGHKIMGGLVDVWINADDREQAILNYFGVDNLASVIDILEQKIGDALYSSDDIGATYAIVALQIQNAVADNTLIQ